MKEPKDNLSEPILAKPRCQNARVNSEFKEGLSEDSE